MTGFFVSILVSQVALISQPLGCIWGRIKDETFRVVVDDMGTEIDAIKSHSPLTDVHVRERDLLPVGELMNHRITGDPALFPVVDQEVLQLFTVQVLDDDLLFRPHLHVE